MQGPSLCRDGRGLGGSYHKSLQNKAESETGCNKGKVGECIWVNWPIKVFARSIISIIFSVYIVVTVFCPHLCFDNNVLETFWWLKPFEIKLNWQKTTVNHSPPPGFIFIKSWNQVINNTFPFLLQVCVWFAPWRRLTDTSRKWLDLLRLWKQLYDVFCVSGGSSESNSDDVTWDFESLH